MIKVSYHETSDNALEEFLIPMELTQRESAGAIHVPYQRVSDLVNGRRGITPNPVFHLAKYFGNPPAFWMNLQSRWDLYSAEQAEKKVLQGISPYQPHPAGD